MPPTYALCLLQKHPPLLTEAESFSQKCHQTDESQMWTHSLDTRNEGKRLAALLRPPTAALTVVIRGSAEEKHSSEANEASD